jgi:hypothetical protein
MPAMPRRDFPRGQPSGLLEMANATPHGCRVADAIKEQPMDLAISEKPEEHQRANDRPITHREVGEIDGYWCVLRSFVLAPNPALTSAPNPALIRGCSTPRSERIWIILLALSSWLINYLFGMVGGAVRARRRQVWHRNGGWDSAREE